MAKKNNLDSGRGTNAKPRSVRSSSSKFFKAISPAPAKDESPVGGVNTPPRLSPVRVSCGQASTASPRTSPGLLARHYAGCKFTEPPLPSALPPPPQHWMQPPRGSVHSFTAAAAAEKPEQLLDVSHQLKVLLKVQA